MGMKLKIGKVKTPAFSLGSAYFSSGGRAKGDSEARKRQILAPRVARRLKK